PSSLSMQPTDEGRRYGKAEAEGLEPPCGCPRRISSAVPYQLGLRLHSIYSVGTGGFEPPTPRSRSECSTGLSHVPNMSCGADGVGFEPTRALTPHDFQSCSLSRSDTRPRCCTNRAINTQSWSHGEGGIRT